MVGGLLKSTSTLALMAAAGLLIGGVTLAPKAARAADLGGDCCADLEERVANLEATTVRKGNKKVSLTISGRVAATMTYWSESPALTNAANGAFDHNSDLSFGDASGNGPNLIFKGDGKVSSDLTAGFYLEIGDGFSGSMTQTTHQNGPSLSGANTYVYLSSKSLGTLQLGRVDNAGDEYNVNFDGSYMGGYTATRAPGSFISRSTTGKFTSNSYLSTLETGAKGDGIRYISNDFGGLSFNASTQGDDNWGAGANFAKSFGTVSVGLGVGYEAYSRVDACGATATVAGNNCNELGLSAGIKESGSGLFLSGDYSKRSIDGQTYSPTNIFVNAGWAKNVSGMGDTTIHVAYDRTNDLAAQGASAHSWVVGLDQAIASASTNVFVAYENLSIDTPVTGDAAGSISTITAGMAVKF